MKINCSIVHKYGFSEPYFGSLSVGLSMEYEVPDTEDPRDRIKGLYECVEAQVKQEMVIAKTALVGNSRPPDKAGGAPPQRPAQQPPQKSEAPPRYAPGNWRAVVTPIPKKCRGWTLGQVEKHEPGSLTWLQENYEPKPWTDKEGHTRDPSKKDIDLRQALNDSMVAGGLMNPPELQQSLSVPGAGSLTEMAARAIDEAYRADTQGGGTSVPF